jgi:hypothetical protein
MKWIQVNKQLPKENETVWAMNKKERWVMLASLVYQDGWLWAVSNGIIYAENKNIVSECEIDDNYDVTHWQALPKLTI